MTLFVSSTDILSRVASYAQKRIGIIGVGGVASGWQAYAKILVGADLVQLYTGLALHGPQIAAQILQELVCIMQAEGLTRLADAKGQISSPVKAIRYASRLSPNSL